MRKSLVILAMIGFGVTFLCSCGNKSVKGADGTEYSSYQEACRHQDFVAAYDWIEKNNGSDDDKDYVFNAEMLYLTSLGTEEASNRIVYLLAEYQIPGLPVQINQWYTESYKTYKEAKLYVEGVLRFNRRCDNIIDMALTQNNKSLVEKIINLYKQDIGFTDDFSPISEEHEIRCESFSWESRDEAKKKYDEAFGKNEVEEKNNSEEVIEPAPAQPAPKKSVKSKRRRR